MAAYVLLTVFLFQRGSAESRKPGRREEVDRDPRASRHDPNAPFPVRQGGILLSVYEHSLTLALVALFAGSFVLHVCSGAAAYDEQQRAHGEATAGRLEFLASPQFWFQSFQNWQSEFFGLGTMLVLAIVLRQRGSPESKPVDAPHAMTGTG